MSNYDDNNYLENIKNLNLNYQQSNNNNFSNFSIDHILNKAGEKSKIENIQKSAINFYKINNTIDNNREQNQMIIPIFNWLHYTRYKPPKIPRPFRNVPQKRTPGRLPRVPFTPAQLEALERSYKISNYLSSEQTNKLALELQLTNDRVKIWFQNRRARERREKREQQLNPDNVSSSSSSISDNTKNQLFCKSF